MVFETSDDTSPALDTAGEVSPPPPPSISNTPLRPPPLVASSPIGHDHGHLEARAPPPAPPPPPSHLSSSLPFSLDELFSTRIPVLDHCPKSARGQYKELLRVVFSDVSRNPSDVSKWTRALSVSKLILFIPPGKKTFKEKAAVVKLRITAFLQCRYDDLWRQATSSAKGRKPAPKPQETLNVRRATRLAHEGLFGQAAKALVSEGMNFDSDEAINAMRSKHPHTPPPTLPLPSSHTPYSFTATEVLAALNSFHSTSAAGPTGLRAAHFKDALAAKDMTAGLTLINVMCNVINITVKGGAPQEIAPYLCGTNLFAANKKDGGYRPIAVGETIRRWVAKCLVKKGIEEAADHFSPFQLGVGVKGRCESIIHAASSIIADERTPVEDKWVLQVDMDNAFNSISREKMLVEVCKVCPKLYAFSKYCYENLYFGPHWINSTTGAQQSDPLAILFFTLVAPLIKRIKDESPGLLLNAWYLDDGTIVGNRNKLAHSFGLLSKFGPNFGLFLNAKKYLVWAGDDESMPNIHDPLKRGVRERRPAVSAS